MKEAAYTLLAAGTLLLCGGSCDALDIKPAHSSHSLPRAASPVASGGSAPGVGGAPPPSVLPAPTATWEAIQRTRTRRMCGGASHRLRMCHTAVHEPYPSSTRRTIPDLMCKDGVCILQGVTAEEAAALLCHGEECAMPPPAVRITRQTQHAMRRWVDSDDQSTHRGVCTYWNASRGYGFIATVHASAREAAEHCERPPSIFVHCSDVTERQLDGSRRLNVGDTLEFELARHVHSDKLKAVRVTALSQWVSRWRYDLDALTDQLLSDTGSSETYAP